MKAPLCPKCETQHYSTQPCKVSGSLKTASKKLGNEGGTGRKSPDDIGRASEEKACLTAALTPAERQKRWRTTGDVEKKREANRLRMRRKRGED